MRLGPSWSPAQQFWANEGNCSVTVTTLHLSTSRCCLASSSLHNNSWGSTSSHAAPYAVATNTSPPQAPRSFSSVFLGIRSHQRGASSGSQWASPHISCVPAGEAKTSRLTKTAAIWRSSRKIQHADTGGVKEGFLIPKLSVTSNGRSKQRRIQAINAPTTCCCVSRYTASISPQEGATGL